ncbi:MAG TPA: ABC transporter permease [Aggregatilineales bacterium]|nr:ABC transporter permease [Aggregatilineales bacterium]
MVEYAARRMIWMIPVLLAVSLITFTLIHLVPGDPCNPDPGQHPIPPIAESSCKEKYGLDQPLFIQYTHYLANVLQGDFGVSLFDSRTVNEIIVDDFPVSAAFGLGALLIGLGLGIPLGLYCAARRNSTIDRLCTVLTMLIIATPSFVFAILLIFLFAGTLHLVTVLFYRDQWQSWLLPLALLGMRIVALVQRFVRAGVLEILYSDYIRTAHSKGLKQTTVYVRHVLRNGLLPLLTLLGPLAADLLTGSFIIESIFGIPGLGHAFVISVVERDYPLLMGVTLFFALLLFTFNLIVDLSYPLVDPRMAYR